VHGSGEADSATIRAVLPNGRYKTYSPEEMAALLEKEGLTKAISRVNVFSCGSGLASIQIPAWAQRLKEQMIRIGFLEVAVGGYTTDLYPSYTFRYVAALTGIQLSQGTHKGAYTEGSFIYRKSVRIKSYILIFYPKLGASFHQSQLPLSPYSVLS
jgi:hypothetical protein